MKFIKSIFTTAVGDPNRNALMGTVIIVFAIVYSFITKDSVIGLGALASGTAMFVGSVHEDKVGTAQETGK